MTNTSAPRLRWPPRFAMEQAPLTHGPLEDGDAATQKRVLRPHTGFTS